MKPIQETSKFSSSLREIVPKSVGFSFYKAWTWLPVFTTLFYIRYDNSVLGMPIGKFYNLAQMLSATLLFLFVGAILSVKFLPLNKYRSVYVLAILVSGVGTIIATQNSDILPLTILCPVLTGFGEVLIVLMWGEYCSSIGFRKTILFLLVSYLLSAGLFFAVVSIPEAISLWLVPTYPIISVLFLYWGRKPTVRYCTVTAKATDPQLFPKLNRSWLWKVFLSLAVLGFSVNLARYSVESVELATLYYYPVLITAIMLTAILTLIGLTFFQKKGRFDIIVSLVIVIVAIGHVLIPFISSSQGFLVSLVFSIGRSCLFIVSWSIFSDITHSQCIPAAKIFGWGRAVTVGGNFLGILVGSFTGLISTADETMLLVIAIINMFLLIMSGSFFSSGFKTARNLETLANASNLAKQSFEVITEEHGLTAREKEVAALLIRGRSLPYIENELGISHGTANTHAHNIYKKLGVHSRQELLDTFQAAEEEFS